MLIVDDHQLFTEAMRTLLAADGRLEVVGTAQSGREALRLAREQPVDIVLMDMSMPVLDGLATTRRLLALDPAPRVIAVSGHTDDLSRAAALEAGAAAFLTKADADANLADVIVEVGRNHRQPSRSSDAAAVGLRQDPDVVPEAAYVQTEAGTIPEGPGWFVLNARDALWKDGDYGAYTRFEGPESRFAQLGINIGVLQPGQPACLYHGENDQEDFLVLSGECLVLIEGEERRLRTWDLVHRPPWTEHVFVGAGDRPCTILAVGSRTSREVVYPVSELAGRHGASAAETTSDPEQAYAGMAPDVEVRFRDEWLPA